MAYDEGLAQLLRDDLQDLPISEKKMFGGLCFLLNGNMICGVYRGGGMFRLGKDNEAEALRVPGTRPMEFTGRPMRGMVHADSETIADDARRGRLLGMARRFVEPLPAKG